MSKRLKPKAIVTPAPSIDNLSSQSQVPIRLKLVKKTPPTGGPQPEKIRAELNIEKWPAIWRPASSKSKPTLRVLEREITNPDGSLTRSRVEVGYTHLGTLSTEEQKMFYALVKQWEDSGKPETQVFFSDRLLQRLLKKKWGTNVIEAITKALRKLRTIPLEWTNAYHSKTEAGVVLRDRRPLTILSELRIIEREVDGTTNKALGYFKFDDQILSNLLANYTKPLLLDIILQIKSEIGQLLYVHVDLMLARKDCYERRSKELFQDLGLTNPEYNRPYERKRALEKAIKDLQGLPLSTGVLKSASVEKTNDRQDYKVVFQKTARSTALETEVAGIGEGERQAELIINDYSKAKSPPLLEAEELVQHFHKIFHGVDAHSPQSKETGQALSLVSQHGLERARYVVDFAHRESVKTNYQVQHFGAVLNYTSRALADFDRYQQQQQHAEQVMHRQAEEAQREEEQRIRGEARLAALTPEQYRELFEKAKAELFDQYPKMAAIFKAHPDRLEETIRVRMIRWLEAEPMDLVGGQF